MTGIWTEHNADESKLEYCFVTFVFNAVLLFHFTVSLQCNAFCSVHLKTVSLCS